MKFLGMCRRNLMLSNTTYNCFLSQFPMFHISKFLTHIFKYNYYLLTTLCLKYSLQLKKLGSRKSMKAISIFHWFIYYKNVDHFQKHFDDCGFLIYNHITYVKMLNDFWCLVLPINLSATITKHFKKDIDLFLRKNLTTFSVSISTIELCMILFLTACNNFEKHSEKHFFLNWLLHL